MGTSAVTFNGISTYSSDFQAVLQRAVSIAQMPIQTLQNQQADNTSKKEALGNLSPDVASLGSAVAALGSLAATGGGLAASSSNTNLVTVSNVGATAPATYTVSDIQSLASSAWVTSANFANSTTTPVSNSGLVNLTVGANTFNLNVSSSNNLKGLANAINTAGAGVTASILTTSGGNYISISANAPGQAAIQLQAVPAAADQITNTGTGTETSVAHYANSTTTPVSVSGNMSLMVGANTYQLSLTGANNNLTGLQNAINSAGAGVTATVSSDSNGSYLSISTNDASAQTLQLNDTSANLITSSAAGSNADFMLNGSIHVVQPNNTINNVIPGVSFTLQNTSPAGSVTLTLTPDASQISTALQTFVTDYNTMVADVNQQVGSSAGPLSGDAAISDIRSDMLQLVTYWNPTSSSIHSLSDLGITFEDNSGQLSFNPSTFAGLSNTQVSDAMQFLGSSTSGFAQLANNFTQLSDPITGMVTLEENSLDSENTQITGHVNTLTTQVNQLQASMTAKLEAADALCAQLQSEQQTMTASIESLDYVAYGMNYNSNGTA